MSAKAPTYRPAVNGHTARGLYTCGQVAAMLACAPRTVGKRFDRGEFPGGYRLGGLGAGVANPRRIPRDGVLAYCRKYGIPTPRELADSFDVLLVSGTPGAAVPAGWASAPDAFAAGVAVATGDYRVVVLDAAELGSGVARAVARQLAATRPGVRVGIVLSEDQPLVLVEGADFVLKHPLSPDCLAEAVGGAVNGKPVTSRSAPCP